MNAIYPTGVTHTVYICAYRLDIRKMILYHNEMAKIYDADLSH